MEDLVIFRAFLTFPLIGLLIPDAGILLLNRRAAHIPVSHVIIEVTLLICIATCSFSRKYLKRKMFRRAELNDVLAKA
jgi:hypothetical protein